MKTIFNLNFYDKDIDSLTEELNKIIEENGKVSIFTPNVDHIINIKQDSELMNKYSESDYIIADGWPLVATAKAKGIMIKRITGVDLMDSLLNTCNNKGYSIFFLGATDETLDLLKNNIIEKYKKIDDVHCHDGYFNDDMKVINKINEVKPNIIFVGMGSPKQELWIRDNINKLNTNILIGVGGALKIFSNEVGRAPRWVQAIGMEWFYRFIKEPKRLFSRYFIKYPKYLKILVKEFK